METTGPCERQQVKESPRGGFVRGDLARGRLVGADVLTAAASKQGNEPAVTPLGQAAVDGAGGIGESQRADLWRHSGMVKNVTARGQHGASIFPCYT